jgi:hypothetical protein
MRAVPEMMVIIKGMVASTRSVCCTGILLVLVLYTFCILFTDAFHEKDCTELALTSGTTGPDICNAADIDAAAEGEEPEISALFGTMGKSAFTLFIMGTVLDDVTVATTAIRLQKNIWMLAAFIIFILISSFMMLNMLIGVLVEVVGATKEGEDAASVETNVREAIAQIFDSMDKDSNKEISRGEFLNMRKDPKVMAALSDLDIRSSHFHLYAELFFRKEESTGQIPSLSYDRLVSMILRLRPGSFVSALDFAAFAKTITSIHDRVKDRVLKLESLCQELARESEDEIMAVSPLSLSTISRPDANFTLPDPQQPPPMSAGESSPKAPGPGESPRADIVSAFDSEKATPPVSPSNYSPRALLNDTDRQKLKETVSTAIVEELQRRLGMASLDKMGVPLSLMDEELRNRLNVSADQSAEAFMTLGVPQDDIDDATVYV